MAVYVDDQRNRYGRMIMCHMMADTSAELHAMADALDLDRRYVQHPGTDREHYDLSLSKRKWAVAHGAIEVTAKDLVRWMQRRRPEPLATGA